MYRLSKILGKYYRDITDGDYKKCEKDCIVFKGTNSINQMLDHVSQFKGEARKVNEKIVKFVLYMVTHKGSGVIIM